MQRICIFDALCVCASVSESHCWSTLCSDAALWMCSCFRVCFYVCLSPSRCLSAVLWTCCLSFGQSAASLLTLHILTSRCVTSFPKPYWLLLSVHAAGPAGFRCLCYSLFFLPCIPLSSDTLLIFCSYSSNMCFAVVVMCLCVCSRSHFLFSERSMCQPS